VTPFRSHGKGTFVLKGTFAGVRIERSSGTSDPRTLKHLRAMCEALADVGRLDVLGQIRDGGLRLLDVWQHYRAGDWSRLPTRATARERFRGVAPNGAWGASPEGSRVGV
jgi:hypothetical protein